MSILKLFTPNKKLEQQVEQLREETARLRQQVESLKATGAGGDARSHEEIATALSSAVDSLQTQMSQMSNSVSDFAVREVSLQAKVSLEVTPLGTLNYRLIRPEDQIDAQKISTFSLTIVPVPKQDEPGTPRPASFNTQVGIDEIAGIREAQRERLYQQNIYTVGEFLRVGTRARSAVHLAALLEVDREGLNALLSHAQLLTLDGVAGHTASTLFDAGVRGFRDLASFTPEGLLSLYEQHASTPDHAPLKDLTLTQATSWVKTARAYVGLADQQTDARNV